MELLTYGLRRGEVARLQLSDFDWEREVLSVVCSRTGRTRLYPLIYQLSEEKDPIDGVPCAVLEATMECRLPGGVRPDKKAVGDNLWLDLEHGLAIRKRETRINGQLRRVLNSEFAEVLPGLWLPRQSRTEIFAPPDAPEPYHDRAVCTREMTLSFWVVNQTPDDLFDTALTKPMPRRGPRIASVTDRHRVPPLDLAPAYHYRKVGWEEIGRTPSEADTEVWAVKDLGSRNTTGRGRERKLTVRTGRWKFSWDPRYNRVTARPSSGAWMLGSSVPIDRASVIRYMEETTGIFACKKDRLRGREVDKLTVYFPAIRHPGGRWGNAHTVEEAKLAASGTKFCARHLWFDPKTNFWLQRDCGCDPPGYRETFEYPPPESVPRELFEFEVPPDALLEVNDPALGRTIRSEGKPKPNGWSGISNAESSNCWKRAVH